MKEVVTVTAQVLEQQTYLPEPADQVAELLSFLEAHEVARGARPEPRYFLAGAGEGDHVEIPASVHAVLLQVLQAMRAGKAVTVAPHSKLLTTQQAADLLGVSRPTVVKLIDEGLLPGEVSGQRRRLVKLDDLLQYRERRREQQYDALMDTAANYDEDLDDPEVLEERLRRVRTHAAERRRAARG
jgi:excisionase family DNA binding protein